MLLAKVIGKLTQYGTERSRTQSDSPETSIIVQLNQAQHDWMQGKGLAFFCKELTHLHPHAIDASVGSSAYVPPDCIEKELKSIATINIIEYNSHIPTANFAKSAEKYFQDIGVIDKNTAFYHNAYQADSPQTYVPMVGHGTTELYNNALLTILKTPGDMMIITQPTYGLFIQPILSKGGQIIPFPLHSNNGYKPNPQELAQLISSENKKNKEAYLAKIEITLSLLKALPIKGSEKQLKSLFTLLNELKNLTSNSLEKTSFQDLDVAVANYNQTLLISLSSLLSETLAKLWCEKLTLSLCPRVRGYLNINPHMPLGTLCDQSEIDALAKALFLFPDLTVIDDLTYYDLVLPSKKRVQPGTFAKSPLKERTITLYSPSKQFAVAGVRAGICFGPQSYILPITKGIFYGINTTSIYSDTTLQTIFTMKSQARKQYLKENNEDYANHRDLSIMLIEGTKHFNAEQIKAVQSKLCSTGIKKSDHAELLQGIPGLKVLTNPQAGFFLLIDFSRYQGKFLGSTPLISGTDFRQALFSFTNLDTLSGEMCLFFEKPVVRFSYCMKTKDIVESIYRIKALLGLCQEKPVQEADLALEKTAAPQKPKALTPQYKIKSKPSVVSDKVRTSSRERKFTRDSSFHW